MQRYDIVTIDGDGIGPEVCQSAITVLREACGDRLRLTAADGGLSGGLMAKAAAGGQSAAPHVLRA